MCVGLPGRRSFGPGLIFLVLFASRQKEQKKKTGIIFAPQHYSFYIHINPAPRITPPFSIDLIFLKFKSFKMKQVRFLATSFATSMLILLSSCGSGDDTKTEETTATATTTTEKAPEPAPPAKPANVMVMQFKVADFAKWHSTFEAKDRDSIRRSYGLTNYVAGQGLDDPKRVIVLLKMEDANRAKELTASQGMKDRMKEAGVTGTPTFSYLEVVMDDNSTIPQTNRLLMITTRYRWFLLLRIGRKQKHFFNRRI